MTLGRQSATCVKNIDGGPANVFGEVPLRPGFEGCLFFSAKRDRFHRLEGANANCQERRHLFIMYNIIEIFRGNWLGLHWLV